MKYLNLFILLILTNSLYAEITLDNTFNNGGVLEGPDYAIGAELGQQHGSNLFHSFAQFNLNLDENATFSGPDNISNIISRVTGGSVSNIDGTLTSTIPNADFYLINPAGLIFGPNAVLDVQGSFHASSANTLHLQDGGQFNATNPQNSNLTVAPVANFGFLTDSPASLSVNGSRGVVVPIGKTLSLTGGDIEINKSRMMAASGKINITSVAGQDKISVASPTPKQAGDVTVRGSLVTVSGGGGSGGIFIRAGKLLVTDASVIAANTMDANDGGSIDVQANELIANKAGRFMTSAVASGNGGNITIKVKGNAEFSDDKIQANGSFITSGINLSSRSSGNAGSLNMKTGSLNMKNGASISTTVSGSGQGGNINIKAVDNINFSGNGVIGQASAIQANTRSKETNAGSGGAINLEANKIQLNDGALIASNAIGTGKGGTIAMQANNITLTGADKKGRNSKISSLVYSSGDGGTITLNAKQLNILNGTTINATSIGTGQGGNINIQSSGTIKLEGVDGSKYGSLVSADSLGKTTNAGDGGIIKISANKLQLFDGAQIGTSTSGYGQGGKIEINVKEAIFAGKDQADDHPYRSGIFTDSATIGDAGTIVLKADSLKLDADALVTAKTYGIGKGGNITIHSDSLRLTGNSLITARSDGSGDAGKVQLTLGNMSIINSNLTTSALNSDGGDLSINSSGYVYLSNSQISTSVSEEFGGGGNITANPEFIVLNSATIFAKAKKGIGGNINVITTGIYNFDMTPITEVINASSEFGLDGIITIETPDENSAESLYIMPASFFDATGLLNTPCGQRVATNLSSFILKPSEGTPSSFADLLPSGPLLAEQLDTKAQISMNWTPPTTFKVKSSCSVYGKQLVI
ncbi:filamentous hemagglutinin N-terminal domain-containing protein [Candidatus Halobeggiatoa sp. HSG11]|nr:filamentous hemagglutinin N-terminal domain-containing protein [Candidatus Halobeggiatoa sp. HSG11]